MALNFAISQSKIPLRSRTTLITSNYILAPDYTRIWGRACGYDKKRPKSLVKHLRLFEDYRQNRRMLSQFHIDTFEPKNIPESIVKNTGEKLGIETAQGVINTPHEMELNVFCDYCILYNYIDQRPFIVDFLEKYPEKLEGEAGKVVSALVNAKFTILRFEKLLDNGLIKVYDLSNEKNYVLIDQALNNTTFVGCHLVVNLLDLKDYVMTSGGAISFDPASQGGGHVLQVFSKYLSDVKTSDKLVKELTVECVTELYHYCITNGALVRQTVHQL